MQIAAVEDDSADDDAPTPRDEQPPVLLTGHRDGRVRIWDMACEVPGLLATVPFDLGGAGSKLRAVTDLQVLHGSYSHAQFILERDFTAAS